MKLISGPKIRSNLSCTRLLGAFVYLGCYCRGVGLGYSGGSGRVGSSTILKSPIGNDFGGAGNGLARRAACTAESPKLWLPEDFSTRTSDTEAFPASVYRSCLKENGIEAPKLNMEHHGAIGRFRMCAGLMLRRHLLKVSHVVIDGKKIAAPGAKKSRGRKAKTTAAGA